MKIKPNKIFEFWSCDEIAECVDGVSEDLYRSLWRMVGQEQSRDSLVVADIWNKFSDEEKLELNSLKVGE
jgi:hypothetical protein|tara:strand:- start:1657 stop:1866 length:210 start_codon:yes stop_codon:yes gene_type:complete